MSDSQNSKEPKPTQSQENNTPSLPVQHQRSRDPDNTKRTML